MSTARRVRGVFVRKSQQTQLSWRHHGRNCPGSMKHVVDLRKISLLLAFVAMQRLLVLPVENAAETVVVVD